MSRNKPAKNWTPPNNEGPQAVALRRAAIAFGTKCVEPIADDRDSREVARNKALLWAAIDYAVTVSGLIERIIGEKAVADAAVRWYRSGGTGKATAELMRTVERSISEEWRT